MVHNLNLVLYKYNGIIDSHVRYKQLRSSVPGIIDYVGTKLHG